MANVTELVREIEEWQARTVDDALDRVLEATRVAAPVASGETRDSLRVERTGPGSGEIIADTPQAEYTDKGTRGPYTIAAKGGGMLAFFWENGPQGAGDYVYRFVTHPGIKAQNWFEEPMGQRWLEALQEAAG